MAKIDLVRQAKAPQQSKQFLRTTQVTSSLTGEYEWETADFNYTGSYTGSFSGSFQFDKILGLNIVSSSTQTIAHLPTGTMSGSAQLPAGIFSSSAQFLPGSQIISGAAQIKGILPAGTISSSEQVTALGDNQTLSYNSETFGLTISDGNSVDLSGLAGGGGGGGGSGDGLALTASDEGVVLSSNVRAMNFAGDGVVATSDGNALTITVSTGSSARFTNVSASFFLLKPVSGDMPSATAGGVMYSGSAFYVGL